jgi:outer membrane protein assembly factor BamB
MKILRSAIVLLIIVAGVLMTEGITRQQRFSFLPGGYTAKTVLVWAVLILCIGTLAQPVKSKRRLIRILFCLPAFLLIGRYFLPGIKKSSAFTPEDLNEGRLQEVLRVLAAAQEQYRLESGKYTEKLVELNPFLADTISDVSIQLNAYLDKHWMGEARKDESTCKIYVGFPPPGFDSTEIEGVPNCGNSHSLERHKLVKGAPFSGQAVTRKNSEKAFGYWRQHRADPQRTGEVGGPLEGMRWDALLSGEIRSSASIAGNQVFVGAHGNGEVASFRLSDGALLWRIRALNWIHHEPVVDQGLVAFGFGNNMGTGPNGFEVVNQQTGETVWRQLTNSAAMGAPAIQGSLLIGQEGAGHIRAWDLRTGELKWQSLLPGGAHGWMTNPVLEDTVVVITGEPNKWCAVHAQSGRQLRCGALGSVYWGMGHTSAAKHRTTIYTSFIDHKSIGGPLGRVLRLPKASNTVVSLAAVDLPSGKLLWKTSLTGTSVPIAGHFAGTPVVSGSSVIVAFPLIGEVASFSLTAGRLLWRAKVSPARGSVSVVGERVFSATLDQYAVVLSRVDGRLLCQQELPAKVDRAGLSISGATGILTFLNGQISSAPVQDWLLCRVRFAQRMGDKDAE